MKNRIIDKLTIPQIVVCIYLSLILSGAFLLMLPVSSQAGTWTNFVDAIFTATSAICVTGQVTLNTAEHWSAFGQTIIITLIQIGGLGFLTIWMLFFTIRGAKVNLKQRNLVLETLNLSSSYGMQDIVKNIVKVSLSIQALGALALSLVLIPRLGLSTGFFYSIFHSISAFNNAGFDLFGDSLIGFQDNSYILLTIASLVFSGGLGFIVWMDIISFPKNKKLTRYSKFTLILTGIILTISIIFIGLSEWRYGTFNHLSLGDQLANIIFMAVTPRTAGYANVDYMDVSHAGLFMTFILMFIGGSSGSTAGGVKVSTIGLVVMFMYRMFKGEEINVFSRHISYDNVKRAFFIIFVGIIMIISSSMILFITEEIPHGFGMEYILMEVMSCFGTVGLSLGLTPDLTVIGKVVLMLLMFVGRVGLMTFFWSLGGPKKESKVHYPEMNIMVG
ncbi:Trk family potassium uptake protein [Ruoffia tabacinasalis]|uniref:Trk family potassium uptake protein n=1 Tax=Ruoffia tabacinasalis TaxID=87458 RepID=A0A5R9DV61_9LACT|nr:TrkH family potassium uptake protein [Ruoffia tabacinasalis]TLQ39825.1 Trk family potassium uptake protein [Ruoffia tabacinasalis]